MPPIPTKKQSVVSASAALPTTQPVSQEQSTVEASTKKKKPVTTPVSATTATAPTATTVASTTPHTAVLPVVLPVVPHVQTVPTDAPLHPVEPATDNVLSNIIDKVNSLASYIKDIQTSLKVLSKEYDKQQKIIEKAQKKRQNAKNSPSGFAKPNKISDELCDFIGVPHGTEKSRTDITRFINAYVKEHNLNKPENKRFILPDAKLKKILNVGDSDEINYFILQKLISHHFPASASKTAAVAAAKAAV
jgi:chromatin remodeling complex protein RSC6